MISDYSVLKGRPTSNRLATSKNKHYQVLISANGELHRIAVNVESGDGSQVEYLIRSPFEHVLTLTLPNLPEGLHPIENSPEGLAIDYIRSNIGQPWEFKALPYNATGPDNDLNEKIDALVQRAMADENAMVYAFGEPWGPEHDKADKYFSFKPGRGIHNIHMNQGNPPGRFAGDNGVYSDGAILFHFPDENDWFAVFLRFQTQAWHTDDKTGNQVLPADGNNPELPHAPIERDGMPNSDVPDGVVRVIAALVNSISSPEREIVTLLNTSDVALDLTGWAILDKQKAKMPLEGSIEPGGTLAVVIQAPAVLSNQGGIITLVDGKGIKVHGVSYTREQARHPGRTIPFQH
jgi:uncharacterized protein YukJ